MNFENTLDFSQRMDADDPLRAFRSKFFLPQHNGTDSIYFTGNSLGLQPKSVSKYIQAELEDWAALGVEGHFRGKQPWVSYHELFPQQLSRIVGCLPEEVIVMNQLTVNLHLMMVSFYRPSRERYKIICEEKAFPSDQYALESQVRYHGFDPAEAIIEIRPRIGEHTLRSGDIVSAIEEHRDSLALVLIGGLNYYTGQFFDLRTITNETHRAGAYAGFDLAHAAGNVSLNLHEWGVDFACWCCYKYLNSGPGSVGGAFIHQQHVSNKNLPRFAGWWGHNKERRFLMEKGFDPVPTAEGWQLSNAPVLSMAAHKASLDIFDDAGMDRLIVKSKLLSGYLHFILDNINRRQKEMLIEVITPSNEEERGCQVSMLMLKKGREIFDELNRQGVIVDWREPNVIRVAPVPLYNTFTDVWRFGNIITSILEA